MYHKHERGHVVVVAVCVLVKTPFELYSLFIKTTFLLERPTVRCMLYSSNFNTTLLYSYTYQDMCLLYTYLYNICTVDIPKCICWDPHRTLEIIQARMPIVLYHGWEEKRRGQRSTKWWCTKSSTSCSRIELVLPVSWRVAFNVSHIAQT